MSDIDKALTLYGMMADRCERSGFAPRQARVYREMTEFMRGCATAAEAAEKIKNSKYFLAPSAALLQDKLAAQEKAARENEMPDVADVYKKKIAEIDANPQAMYETGYERTAQNLKIPYYQTYEAFSEIYACYAQLCCVAVNDDIKIRNTTENLRAAMSRLQKPSSDFTTLASIARFRRLIPVNDERYALFVKTAPAINKNGPDYGPEKAAVQKEFETLREFISNSDDAVIKEIIGTGTRLREKQRRTKVVVVPPDSKAGKYSFIEMGIFGMFDQKPCGPN